MTTRAEQIAKEGRLHALQTGLQAGSDSTKAGFFYQEGKTGELKLPKPTKTTITSTISVRRVVGNIIINAVGFYDGVVVTATGQPSELSAYGLDRDRAAKVVVRLPSLNAECPEAADVPIANMETVRTLAQAGVPHACAAALAARPARANINQL